MSTTVLGRSAKGVYPISITPFTDNGEVDFSSLDRLTDFFIERGVPGLTLLGILGEAARLSEQESVAIVRHVLRRLDGRAQVIVGCNHVGFANFQRFTTTVMSEGAAGIMVAPVGTAKTEEQILNYFAHLISTIGEDVPLALQDYPQYTGVHMSVATIAALLKNHTSIKVIKHEEASALRKISRLREQEADGERERISILVGNSAIYLPQELQRGADGANTGVAFPEMLIEVCRRFAAGDSAGGEDVYDLFLPLVRYEQQPGIGLAIRKEIFRRRGLIISSKTRGPGPALDRDDHKELSALLDRLQVKLRSAGLESLIASHPISANI